MARLFLILVGLPALGCGSSSESGLYGPTATGSASGSGGGFSTGGSPFGSGGNPFASGGAGSGGAAPCADGARFSCLCSSGTLGSSVCAAGVLGPCDCGSCQTSAVVQCTCLTGGTGTQTCQNGAFGDCAGCPPVTNANPCPAPLVCTPSPFGAFYCASGGGVPPLCQVPADCAALGVACTVSPFGSACIKVCTP